MDGQAIVRLEVKASKRMKRLPAPFYSALMSKANQFIEQGYDVINLAQETPDLPTPLHIVRSLQDVAENTLNHSYPPLSESRKLKEAICHWYKREQGVDLDPDHEVAILSGTQTALVQLSTTLLNPGDIALVPDPGYPDYGTGIALAGATMTPIPLLRENLYLPDLGKITQNQCERAKIMLLNYPSNPTGACAPASFFDDAIRFAEKNQIVVANDFAYGAIGFDEKKPISFLSRPGAKEVGIELYSFSKTYNMAGWGIGFALGNKKVIRLMNLLQDHFYSSPFGAVQAAAVTALTSSQDCVRDLVDIYESRRNSLFRDMCKIGWNATLSEGTFFEWLKVPTRYSSIRFADLLLDKAQVFVAPGIEFGQFGEGYVRVGLLTSEERLREAMRRIQKLSLF
ncbi:aminotransferase class I/II-fold pyridoxal phosphate-dependent enzyme [Cohnella sp.]|uniref:aminotransferase class I/II-fold pyridoxal phosphate-dependent enzyme n=1 Tax=Cohnella sp. TaxID=1883426 RepID=UPI00356296CB